RWGFPLKAEGESQDFCGSYQNFEFSTVYYKWDEPKAYGVSDRIRTAYKLLGYEIGKLGYPISDQKESSGRLRQAFENGAIEVDIATGDVEVVISGQVMK